MKIILCVFDNCKNPSTTRGLCGGHYQQQRAGKKLTPLRNRNPNGSPKEWYVGPKGYVVKHYGLHGKTNLEYQHRTVMEKHLNRKLYPNENVHHINGDKTDNRIENLELWDKGQPAGQRVADKISYCITFLEQHGYQINKK